MQEDEDVSKRGRQEPFPAEKIVQHQRDGPPGATDERGFFLLVFGVMFLWSPVCVAVVDARRSLRCRPQGWEGWEWKLRLASAGSHLSSPSSPWSGGGPQAAGVGPALGPAGLAVRIAVCNSVASTGKAKYLH